MRKLGLVILAISIILLMVSPSFAQSPRQPTSSEGKTSFTNIAVRGLNASGVPGYIEMADTDGDIFYLYISNNGSLMIASDVAVGYQASPQTANWGLTNASGGGRVGVPVGAQTAP